MIATPDEFARAFAKAVSSQDVAALTALLSDDLQGMTLGGQWVEGREAATAAWTGEFAGLLARARMVSGRTSLSMMGPGAAVLSQRFVVLGAQAADGVELPRFPAVMSAVVIARPEGWLALSLNFLAISD